MDKKLSANWDAIKTFLAVEREGSLRGAARSLGVNHGTVRRRLTMLEEAFASRLCEQTPAGLVLTQAGEDLLSAAERMETEFLTVSRRISGQDQDMHGWIRVNMPPALLGTFFVQALMEFSEQYPDIELDIDVSHSLTDLAARDADVTVRMTDRVLEDVVGRRVIDYAKAIYCAPSLLTSGQSAGWIGWREGYPYPNWRQDTPFPDMPIRHRLFSNELHIEAVRAGKGYSLLPCFLADPAEGLVRVPGTSAMPGKSIWVLLHRDLRKVARIRAFVDFIVPAIQKHRRLIEGECPAQ